MIKTLQIGDKEVQFSTAYAWMFIYKSQFGVDPSRAIMPAVKGAFEVPEAEKTGDPEVDAALEEERSTQQAFMLFESIGFVGVAQIAWAMAKLCDRTIPDTLTWVSSFGDDFPAMDIIIDLIMDAILSCFTSKNSQTPVPEKTKRTGKGEK